MSTLSDADLTRKERGERALNLTEVGLNRSKGANRREVEVKKEPYLKKK